MPPEKDSLQRSLGFSLTVRNSVRISDRTAHPARGGAGRGRDHQGHHGRRRGSCAAELPANHAADGARDCAQLGGHEAPVGLHFYGEAADRPGGTQGAPHGAPDEPQGEQAEDVPGYVRGVRLPGCVRCDPGRADALRARCVPNDGSGIRFCFHTIKINKIQV
jgi:hypothetical protein